MVGNAINFANPGPVSKSLLAFKMPVPVTVTTALPLICILPVTSNIPEIVVVELPLGINSSVKVRVAPAFTIMDPILH